MTRYLLGEMSEEEQTELELRYFADQQLFAELCAWRNNLIDAYVSGELDPAMRQRFEAAIEKSWMMNERIRFAETLQEVIDARDQKPAPHGRSRSLRVFLDAHRSTLLGVFFLLMMLAATWLILRLIY